MAQTHDHDRKIDLVRAKGKQVRNSDKSMLLASAGLGFSVESAGLLRCDEQSADAGLEPVRLEWFCGAKRFRGYKNVRLVYSSTICEADAHTTIGQSACCTCTPKSWV